MLLDRIRVNEREVDAEDFVSELVRVPKRSVLCRVCKRFHQVRVRYKPLFKPGVFLASDANWKCETRPITSTDSASECDGARWDLARCVFAVEASVVDFLNGWIVASVSDWATA